MATEPNSVSLNGLSLERLRTMNVPVLLPLGGNLPMHIVRGAIDTGLVLNIRGRQFRVAAPMGSYGSMIRSVNAAHAQAGAPAGVPAASGQSLPR